MKFRDVAWGSIAGTIDQWQGHYNVEFYFTGNRPSTHSMAHNVLKTRLREALAEQG